MMVKTQRKIEQLVETLKSQYPFRYITLRSAELSEDGAHKQPLHRWGDPQYQYDTYDKATQGGRRGVGLVIPKGILVVDVDAKSNMEDVLNRWGGIRTGWCWGISMGTVGWMWRRRIVGVGM